MSQNVFFTIFATFRDRLLSIDQSMRENFNVFSLTLLSCMLKELNVLAVREKNREGNWT